MAYALHFDAATLTARGIALGELTGEALGKVVVTSLNEVVGDAYDLSRKRMIDGINLTDAYLRRKMVLTEATSGKPVATLLADGNEALLRNFGANLLLVPRTTTKPNRNQGKIGIPRGMKQHGTSVAVTKDGRQRFPMTFMLPLKAGNVEGGNGLAVFTRARGSKDVRIMLGPAVYQLFKYQLNGTLVGDAEDMLEQALATQVQAAMEKILT